jgi:hypothetical protein
VRPLRDDPKKRKTYREIKTKKVFDILAKKAKIELRDGGASKKWYADAGVTPRSVSLEH